MVNNKCIIIGSSFLLFAGCSRTELAPYELGSSANITPVAPGGEIYVGPRVSSDASIPIEESPKYDNVKYEKPMSVVEHPADDLDDEEPKVKTVKVNAKSEEPKKAAIQNKDKIKKDELMSSEIKPTTNTQKPTSPKNWKLVDNGKVISKFGDIVDGYQNDGIMIKAPLGSSVRSIKDGEVIYSGSQLKEYGNIVVVKHDGEMISTYAHLQKATVNKGDLVKAGTEIGKSGKSGDAKQPQLYLQLMKDSKPINPMKYVKL